MSKLRSLLFQSDDSVAPNGDKASAATQLQADKAAPAQAVPQDPAAVPVTPGLSLTGSLLGRPSNGHLAADQARERAYYELKSKIHTRLIENLDINALMALDQSESLEAAIERTLHVLIDEERLPITVTERHQIAREVLYETLGLGPLEPLLADPSVNDILVNGSQSVWVDRNGKLELTAIRFKDDNHLLYVISRIVARIGRRVDEASPIVDARLPDGSRVNAIIPPLAIDGPSLSIRRFKATPFKAHDMIDNGTLNKEMAEFLGAAVKSRLNILVSGGTSAGKTTLLNMLSSHISDDERIVTIEDTAELSMQQRHVVRLESRPSNSEGQGLVTQRDLVKNALRMRPDRIVVGEVRGAEALDMLQAMNTGHEGSLTTVHANSPRDALSRIETLVLLAGIELSQRSIREQIASAFDLVVQIKRMRDGTRRVASVAEVTGVQEGVISMQELFEFRQDGLDSSGTVIGAHRSCGLRPQKENKFKEAGIDLPAELFNSSNSMDGER